MTDDPPEGDRPEGNGPDNDRPAGNGTENDRLGRYRSKRNFARTAEPAGEPAVAATPGVGESRFVIQKHAARRLHYDVRFESDGVLVSWAVPKGPSLDPSEKRLAVHVEDHPLDYANFEGTIPGGEYGAGAVIVWDEGTYRTLTEKRGKTVPFAEAVASGHVSVWLDGIKLHGGWSLTRTSRPGDQESWIMVKRNDEQANRQRDVTSDAPDSALTGRSLEDVREDAVGPPVAAGASHVVPADAGPATAHAPGTAGARRRAMELRAQAGRFALRGRAQRAGGGALVA